MTNREITYDKFIRMLDDGQVKSVTLTADRLKITPKSSGNSVYQVTYDTGIISMDYSLVERLSNAGVEFEEGSHGQQLQHAVYADVLSVPGASALGRTVPDLPPDVT